MAKKKKRGKNQRKRQQRKAARAKELPSQLHWVHEEHVPSLSKDGLHALVPGVRPSEQMMTELAENFRKELRNSPLWNEMVEKFGEEEAEKLLTQVNVELRG